MAIRYPQRKSERRLAKSAPSNSLVWNNLNAWLRFQVEYISERQWAGTPIIKAVTLVNVYEFDVQDLLKLSMATKLNIERTISRYQRSFDGLKEDHLRNWLIRNYLLCNAFSDQAVNPIDDDGVLVEIGPGLGGVLSLAQKSNIRTIYNLDTIEMQAVFSAIEEPDDFKSNQIVKIPVNSGFQFTNIDEDEINYVIAFWSFTELRADDRIPYIDLFKKANKVLIACNEYFEGINNFEYLESLSEQLQMKVSIKSLSKVFATNIPSYQKNHRLYLLER